MIKFSMRVDRKELDALQTQFATEARQAVIDAAHGFEGGAKTKAPVLTGNLKNSINVRFSNPFMAIISDATAYGLWQEFNNPNGHQAYFGDTAEEIAPKFFDALRAILDRLGKK